MKLLTRSYFLNFDSSSISSADFPVDQNGYKWKALATIALGTITVTMDASIANISLPTLTRVFNAELTTVMWVSLIFTVVGTSLMLVLGRIGDYLGKKLIYTTGMLIFTFGMAGCSIAQSVGQLIAFRALQAAGGAMTIACGQAIITEAFPPNERGKGLGLFGVAISIGFIVGPILGGFLLKWLEWRSIFYTRIPVGLMAFFMGLVLLKKDSKRIEKIELDIMGALTSSAGLFCFVFGMSQVAKFGIKSPIVYLFMSIGILSLVIFTFVERHAKDPIVDLTIFKNRTFSYAIYSLFLTFIAMPFFFLIVPFYLMQGVGLSSSTTGLLFAVIALATIAGSPVSGWLSDRFGPHWFSSLGVGTIAAAFVLMRGFDLQTTIGQMIPILALFGFGMGVFQAPNSSTIMGSASRDRLGTASALMGTVRQVGLSVGMALAGTIFSARKVIHESELNLQGLDRVQTASLSVGEAFQDILLVSLFLQLLALLFCLLSSKKSP
jgi:EmrB/QacA subfamily drug resistance transporter